MEEKTKNLMQKIIEAEKKFPAIEKDANNPFAKSKYISLEEIVGKIKPPLLDQGVIFIQNFTVAEGGMTIDTTLTDGTESVVFTATIPLPEMKGVSITQMAGAAITYGKRYHLLSIFGLAAGEDLDQQDTSGLEKKAPPKPGLKTQDAEKPPQQKDERDEKARALWALVQAPCFSDAEREMIKKNGKGKSVEDLSKMLQAWQEIKDTRERMKSPEQFKEPDGDDVGQRDIF